MRWELLFADLEARLTAAERAELDAEIDERARDERADVALAGRLLAAKGRRIVLVVRGGTRVAGTLVDGAGTWALVESVTGEALVPLAAVTSIEGLPRVAAAVGAVDARLRMSTVLRELAEARVPVIVEADGGHWRGVIVAVGADHLDLAVPGGERALPLAALLVVRAAP